jgi:uncharacterized protein with GYD domain
MPKYMFIASLTSEGVAGVLKQGGTARKDAVAAAAKTVGGSLESFYFAFGAEDVYATCDLPSNEAAAAVAMNVSATGRVGVRTVVLLTPDEIDGAAKQKVQYQPPGG